MDDGNEVVNAVVIYCSVALSNIEYRESGQPSILKGNRGIGGFGPPNPTHKLITSPQTSPVSAPCKKEQL